MHSLLWLCLTREALVVCVLKLCYHVGRVLASIVQHAQAVLHSTMHQVEQSSAALLQMAEAAEPISYSRLARLFTCMRTLPLHLVISCAHVHVPVHVCVEMDAHHTCLHAM